MDAQATWITGNLILAEWLSWNHASAETLLAETGATILDSGKSLREQTLLDTGELEIGKSDPEALKSLRNRILTILSRILEVILRILSHLPLIYRRSSPIMAHLGRNLGHLGPNLGLLGPNLGLPMGL